MAFVVALGDFPGDGEGDCGGIERDEVLSSWKARCSHRYLLRPRNQSHSVLYRLS